MAKEKILRLKEDITAFLLDKLERFEISVERAGQIAHFVIEALPDNLSDDQLMEILPSLDDEFTELSTVILKYLNEYEEKNKTVVTDVQKLIKEGHLENASMIMKNYFNHKMKW